MLFSAGTVASHSLVELRHSFPGHLANAQAGRVAQKWNIHVLRKYLENYSLTHLTHSLTHSEVHLTFHLLYGVQTRNTVLVQILVI